MGKEDTHLLFGENRIDISPNIVPTFNFLMEVEKEVESMLGFYKKLEGIKKNYLEMVSFVGFLSDKLKENNIDFQYTFPEHPEKIIEKLDFYNPLRSQAIVIFANLEVVFNLYLAYQKETSDENELRSLVGNLENVKRFINQFVLNDKNAHYKSNKTRFCKIDAGKLRKLRNSLTHFFSISHGGLSLSPSLLKDKAIKLENIFKKMKRGDVVFISEDDLFNLVKYANLALFKEWSDDFKNNHDAFERKIRFVIDLVQKEGAVIVQNKHLIF